jgi:hypothetical protein
MGCGATFHADCRRELGRCSSPGCAAKEPGDGEREQLSLRGEVERNERRQTGETHVSHDPTGLAKLGGMLAFFGFLVGGFMIGGAMSTPHDFHLPSALKWAASSIPAGLAGVLYGGLQGLVGLRDPQPEGGGCVTMFLVMCAGFGGFYLSGGSTVGAILLAFSACLLGGRAFGFDPGNND